MSYETKQWVSAEDVEMITLRDGLNFASKEVFKIATNECDSP